MRETSTANADPKESKRGWRTWWKGRGSWHNDLSEYTRSWHSSSITLMAPSYLRQSQVRAGVGITQGGSPSKEVEEEAHGRVVSSTHPLKLPTMCLPSFVITDTVAASVRGATPGNEKGEVFPTTQHRHAATIAYN